MSTPKNDEMICDLKKICKAISLEITARQKGQKAFKSHVSDHAVLRYLQRVKGIDVDAVRQEILALDTHGVIKLGACRIKGDGFELVVANGTVVTVIGG